MKHLRTAFGPRELVATLGLGLIGAGLAMVSIPTALVVTGALLLALATLPLMRRGERSK